MQGKADVTIRHIVNHQARGAMSPVGGGQPDPFLIHRDEDVASAPMSRTRTGVHPTNRQGGITPIKGRFPTQMSDD
jgi:hypothetical protein